MYFGFRIGAYFLYVFFFKKKKKKKYNRNDQKQEAPFAFPMNLQNKTNDPLILSGRHVTACLGTNTGKTHLAIERMVAHGPG